MCKEKHEMTRTWILRTAAVTAMAAMVLASTLVIGGPRDRARKAKEVTLTGKVGDLHSFMAGEAFRDDVVRQRIYDGAPIVLQTNRGPVVLGTSKGSVKEMILPAANQTAEAVGRLYEKRGIRYLELTTIRPQPPSDQQPGHEEWEEEDYEEEEDDFEQDSGEPESPESDAAAFEPDADM